MPYSWHTMILHFSIINYILYIYYGVNSDLLYNVHFVFKSINQCKE